MNRSVRLALPLVAVAAVLLPHGAASASTTCSTPDSSLPVPVAGTAVDTLGTVQSTVAGVAGALPVDVAGTVSSTLGCTSGSSDPGTGGDTGTGDTTGTQPVSSAALQDAPAAAAVKATPAFTG